MELVKVVFVIFLYGSIVYKVVDFSTNFTSKQPQATFDSIILPFVNFDHRLGKTGKKVAKFLTFQKNVFRIL